MSLCLYLVFTAQVVLTPCVDAGAAMVRYTYVVKALVLQYRGGTFSREWVRFGSVGYRTEADAWNAITENWNDTVDLNFSSDPNRTPREVLSFDVVKSIAFNWS